MWLGLEGGVGGGGGWSEREGRVRCTAHCKLSVLSACVDIWAGLFESRLTLIDN